MIDLQSRYPVLLSLINSNNQCWCSLPFINLCFTTDGKYGFCCSTPPTSSDIQDVSIEEYFESKDWINLTTEMFSGIPNTYYKKFCMKCYECELINIQSKRQRKNKEILFNLQNDIKLDFYDKVESVLLKLKHDHYVKLSERVFSLIDFKIFGNTCTLKCIMCKPLSSSAIAKEESLLGNWNEEIVINPFKSLSTSQLSKFYTDLDTILPNTTTLDVTGGEPILSDKFVEFNQYIVENNHAKNLTMFITTNGMNVSTKLIELFKFYQRSFVRISIDGYGEINSLQRVGSDFNVIDKNIDYYKTYKFLYLRIGPTVTPVNIKYLDDLYMYSFFKIKEIPLFNLCIRPKRYSIMMLPEDIKTIYLQKLLSSKYVQHYSIFISVLQNGNYHEKSFKQYIAKMLSIHGKDTFLKYFPEYKSYIV